MSKIILTFILLSSTYVYSASIWLGFIIEEKKEGLFISRVIPNSPASKAGIKRNHQVLEVDKKVVNSLDDFFKQLKDKEPQLPILIKTRNDKVVTARSIIPISPPTNIQKLQMVYKDQKIPDLHTVKLFEDQPEILKKVRENEIILMFWATWCPSCHKSFKRISGLTEVQKNQFIFVSDESVETIKKHLKKKEILIHENQFYHLSDNSDFYLINALPTFMKINKHGIVERISIGANTGLNKMISE